MTTKKHRAAANNVMATAMTAGDARVVRDDELLPCGSGLLSVPEERSQEHTSVALAGI